MKYRSRTDIVFQILEAANSGATKTKIMADTFVEFAKLRRSLEMLAKEGLLDVSRDFKTFKTSAKGLKYLKMCDHTEGELRAIYAQHSLASLHLP